MPDRLARSAATLLAALLPLIAFEGAAEGTPKKCRYVKLQTLPVEFANGQPNVEGTINGRKVPMLLDTRGKTSLTRRGAEDLGLAIGHSNRAGYGVTGESPVYQARVDEISIGPVKGGRATLLVMWNITGKVNYGAVIGGDFLFQRDLEISLAERRVTFFHPIDCDDAFLAYWDRDAFVADFGPGGAPGDPPHIVVKLNGQKVRAVVNSGSTLSMIDLAAAARAGITPESRGAVKGQVLAGFGKHLAPTWIAPVESLVIGNETIANAKITIVDLWGAVESDLGYRPRVEWLLEGPEMILGADFLKAHRVLFALSQRRLYFSYLGGEMFYVSPE